MKLGINGKLYKNDGDYATPTWTEITNVRDLTLNMDAAEADATTRANNRWRATAAALRDASVEFEMVWDTADAGFQAIRDAWKNGADLEMAVVDGDIATSGTEGLRATFAITGFNRNEPLEDTMTANVTIKPGYSANPPEWHETT